MNIMSQCVVYFGNCLSQGSGGHTKIGKTGALHNRKGCLDTSYSMEGIDFGYLILCESENQMDEMEEYLHSYFWDYSTTQLPEHSGGGLEWFGKLFTKYEIKEALEKGNYDNNITDDPVEIDKALEEYKKIYETEKKEYIEKMNKIKRDIEKRETPYHHVMRDYQVTENIMNWFDINDKGILNWCCGLGKTLASLNISTKYFKKYLLIGLNNISLISQWIDEVKRFYDIPILCICSTKIRDTITTTKLAEIKEWFNKNPKGVIITTFRSSNKLKDLEINYDFAIFDECHHLCNSKYCSNSEEELEMVEENKCRNTDILSLNIKKQIGLTATMKKLDSENKQKMIDNFDENKFGKVIDEKSILWGINNGYICDYSLSMLKVDYEVVEEMINKNEDIGIHKDDYYLFLSAYISLISILNYGSKKILIFTNRICDIEKVYNFINMLIPTLPISITKDDIFKIDKNTENTRDIIVSFESRNIAIMINVFKIGEGVDIPCLDSVLFADNMLSSIRIIQSALRCCRKDPNNPEKHAKIIIPMIYEEDESYCEEDNGIKIKTFPLIKRIVEEISYSDKNIISKVKVDELNGETELKPKDPQRINEDIPEIDNEIKMRIIKRCNIGKLKISMIKKNIQTLGGRKCDSNTYVEDYKKTKQLNMSLPDYDWMKEYVDRNNYTWLDLYSVDVHQYMIWVDFEKKYYKTQESEYNDMPLLHDLEDVYPKYNKRFWDESGLDCDEF
jgi:superfamily II DNA or RNA helicase